MNMGCCCSCRCPLGLASDWGGEGEASCTGDRRSSGGGGAPKRWKGVAPAGPLAGVGAPPRGVEIGV